MPVKDIVPLNGIESKVGGIRRFGSTLLLTGILGLTTALGVAPAAVYGHGAVMEFRSVPGLMVQARYDNGMPMAQAGVVVYAPDNPTRPWLTGVSDEQGFFRFVPDPEVPGIWSVQARQAGHGAMIHIAVGTDPQAVFPAPAAVGLSPLQRLLMAVAVVWGFIGTALYFSRRRSA